MGHCEPPFIYLRLFYKQQTVNNCSIKIQWLDLNPGNLVLEATALSTASQSLAMAQELPRTMKGWDLN